MHALPSVQRVRRSAGGGRARGARTAQQPAARLASAGDAASVAAGQSCRLSNCPNGVLRRARHRLAAAARVAAPRNAVCDTSVHSLPTVSTTLPMPRSAHSLHGFAATLLLGAVGAGTDGAVATASDIALRGEERRERRNVCVAC